MTKRWNRALVTGASSGIGDAASRLLASEGTDLVIVARNELRLEQLASDLDVDVEVLPADLGDPQQLAKVERRVAATDDPIDLLINNAGFGFHGDFVDLDVDGETSVIDVNITALTRLSHAAGRRMVEHGGGAILNVASIAGMTPSVRTATYGASKAFVINLTEAIHEELRPHGVTASALCPGFTRTEFQSRADYDASSIPDRFWQTAEVVAAAGLDGLEKGRTIIVPGLHNKVAAGAVKLLPGLVSRKAVDRLSD